MILLYSFKLEHMVWFKIFFILLNNTCTWLGILFSWLFTCTLIYMSWIFIFLYFYCPSLMFRLIDSLHCIAVISLDYRFIVNHLTTLWYPFGFLIIYFLVTCKSLLFSPNSYFIIVDNFLVTSLFLASCSNNYM